MACDVDAGLAMGYLDDVDNVTQEELRTPLQGKTLMNLDVKVYAAVIGAIKGREHMTHMKDIRGNVKRGNGRLAWKLLDIANGYEPEEIADDAAESVVEEKCKDIDHAEA